MCSLHIIMDIDENIEEFDNRNFGNTVITYREELKDLIENPKSIMLHNTDKRRLRKRGIIVYNRNDKGWAVTNKAKKRLDSLTSIER